MDHWELTDDWRSQLGSWARQMMLDAIDDFVPELKDDLPVRTPWRVWADYDAMVLVLIWRTGAPSSVNSFASLGSGEFATIKAAASFKRSYRELCAQPSLNSYFGRDSFLWVASMRGKSVNLAELQQQTFDWLQDRPLAVAEGLED